MDKPAPDLLKVRIAKLMSDGRHRTFNDICTALKVVEKKSRENVKSALRSMMSKNLLETYNIGTSKIDKIWKIKKETD